MSLPLPSLSHSRPTELYLVLEGWDTVQRRVQWRVCVEENVSTTILIGKVISVVNSGGGAMAIGERGVVSFPRDTVSRIYNRSFPPSLSIIQVVSNGCRDQEIYLDHQGYVHRWDKENISNLIRVDDIPPICHMESGVIGSFLIDVDNVTWGIGVDNATPQRLDCFASSEEGSNVKKQLGKEVEEVYVGDARGLYFVVKRDGTVWKMRKMEDDTYTMERYEQFSF